MMDNNSFSGEDMSIPTIDSLIALRRIFKESSSNVNATGVTSLTDGGSANQNSPASKRARISNSQSVEEAEVSSSTAPGIPFLMNSIQYVFLVNYI